MEEWSMTQHYWETHCRSELLFDQWKGTRCYNGGEADANAEKIDDGMLLGYLLPLRAEF